MFRCDMTMPELIGIGPAYGRIVITNSHIFVGAERPAFFDRAQDHHKYSRDQINKNWAWLKINKAGELDEDVLEKMKECCMGRVLLCDPAIIDALNKMGLRDKYPEWQAPGTDELEQYLIKNFPHDYNPKTGFLEGMKDR